MKYKVTNLESDMKLKTATGVVCIKRGTSMSVSIQEYQYLAQVYGMAVKGEKEYTVRITKPVQICEIVETAQKPAPVKKRRSRKR